ncbi:MAG: DUF2202 domain-containing protein [Micropruina sp.]|nr:DUF2202 domain-containing protein [Micropruina sp.]
MKTSQTRTVVAIAISAIALLGWGVTAQGAPTPEPTPVVQATADAALAASLTHMREEERLARDLYTALAAEHDQARPLASVARSEQRHFDAIGVLLTRYGVADPAAGRTAGSYADPTLQKLYDSLLADGKKSLAAANQAGVAVETLDIADLEKAIAAISQADVKTVYGNLLTASKRHLEAFTAAANGQTLDRPGAGPRQDGTTGQRHGGGRQGQNGDGQRPADCPLR